MQRSSPNTRNSHHRSRNVDDALLGERPPWLLAATLGVLSTILGVAAAAVIAFTESEQTARFKVSIGNDAAPVAVRAPRAGVIEYLYATEGAVVRANAPLIRLRLAVQGSVRDTQFCDLLSPAAGAVSYIAHLQAGTAIAGDAILLAIRPDAGAKLPAIGYVDASLASVLRPGQGVRLLDLTNTQRRVVRGGIESVAPLPSDHRYRIVISFDPPIARGALDRADFSKTEWDAVVAVRRKTLTQRAFEMLRRLLV